MSNKVRVQTINPQDATINLHKIDSMGVVGTRSVVKIPQYALLGLEIHKCATMKVNLQNNSQLKTISQ